VVYVLCKSLPIVEACHAHRLGWACECPRNKNPIMPAHRKTVHHYNDPGHAHMLTFSCFQRRPFLSKDGSRQWMIEAIELARTKHHLDFWAYVLMPEHVHLLLWPTTAEYSISAILTTIKQSVSKRALSFVKQNAPAFLSQMADIQPNGAVQHRFWQRGGGHDRNLIEPRAIWAEIDYIHANPVRRGLCIRPTDWIWSSAIEYEFPGQGLLTINRNSLPRTKLG